MTNPAPGNQSQATFSVSYDGPALAGHSMQVRDLAPALLALGQSFDRANGILNGDRAQIGLEIRATSAGSFEVGLLLRQVYDAGVAGLSGDFVTSAANLKTLFFGGAGGGVGLFAAIKVLKGRRITEATQQGGSVTLELEQTTRLTIPREILQLNNDSILREQLAAVVRPLGRDGIDELVIRDESQRLESVSKAEAQYFRGADSEFLDVSTTLIPRQRLQPKSANFMRKGKWRLTDGDKVRWYKVNDETFLREVEEGVRLFGAKDVLICEVIMRQSIGDTGELRMEYEIASVLDHIHAPTQAMLLADEHIVIREAGPDVDSPTR